MTRMARCEILDPLEVAIAHVCTRVCRRCFLLGDDPVSGKNFDHRKVWIEEYWKQFAAFFGIDLIGFSILSNHFHLILRARPDVVAAWSDEEVARRWLMLCPHRRNADGSPMTPTEPEIKSIAGCPIKRAEIRQRLSSFSCWMWLLCQRVRIDEHSDPVGPCASESGTRCSDKGFLAMPLEDYLELLDWTARHTAAGKRGRTPAGAPPILVRLGLDTATWCELVSDFGRLFCSVAGRPECVDSMRCHRTHRRYRLRRRARELLTATD